MKVVALLFLVLFINPLCAIDLFGLDLASATQEQLRAAIKKSGARPVNQKAGEQFYDTYLADSLLKNAQHLYVGFVKQSRKFAFAEYELNGLKQSDLLQKLQAKYGQGEAIKGKYITDYRHQWHSGEVVIILYQDWAAYKTRLTYYIQGALIALKEERSGSGLAGQQKLSGYLEQAY